MKKKILLSFLCFSLLQADEFQDISSLSLEELLNIKVTGVSKRSEDQNFAPGIVTVVSSQEIHQYGARHLRDVIDRLVGMQVLSTHLNPHAQTSIRGVNANPIDVAVLILINGRPFRESNTGNSNHEFYLGFPLETIDHIEVIRGPGSVIYGSNAMAGVINIVTKNAQTAKNETQIDVGMGSFGRQQAQVSTLLGGKDYSLNVGFNHISSNGDNFDGIIDRDLNSGTYKTGEKSDNLLVDGTYKNLTFNALLMDSTVDTGSSAFQLPSQPVIKKRAFLDLGYHCDITEGWDALINYTFNAATQDWQVNEAVGYDHSISRSHMIETVVRGNIDDDLNLLFGVNYTMNSGVFDFGLLPVHAYNESAFAQIDYMLSPTQKIILGTQFNKPESLSGDFSSRGGFIQQFGDNWWLKLLYSEAYRSPSLVEKYINNFQLHGLESLNPEKIVTKDIHLIYQTPTKYFALALYDSIMNDLIVRYGANPSLQANEGGIRFQGIELEGKVAYSDALNFIGNVSYQTNKTLSGIKDSTFAPKVMAKIGADYSGFYGMNIGAFNSYFGKSTDLSLTNGAPANNPTANAYNLLTVNISIDTAKTWGIGKPEQSLFSLYLDNLLDKKVYAPDLNFANQNNTIPNHWGRNINATYTYKF